MRVTRFFLALSTTLITTTTHAEPFMLPGCDGTYGLGVMTYSKTEGMAVSSVTELTEVCWNKSTATFTGQESSRDLELTQDQGGTKHYQRLNGGPVSPLNEQLRVGPWEGHGTGASPYFRWTTESSRPAAELGGYDFVTTEGFLLTEAGFTPRPQTATYPLEMVLTARGGTMSSMVYGIFLPMQATLTINGPDFTFDLTGYQQGMGPGNVMLDIAVTETDRGHEVDGGITMENALMAGGGDMFWKTMELRLEEFAPQFSGDEISIVATFVGEAVTFGGESQTVTFSLVGTGVAG